MLKAVFFDLDGTLLPMDQETFVRDYFSRLAKKLAPCGFDPDGLIKGVLAGTEAMVRNDGSCTNEERFWQVFPTVCGEKVLQYRGLLDEFYANDFPLVAKVCGYTPEAARAVSLVHTLGLKCVLATNPLFPSVATESRIRWAGLDPKDFDYVTTYENSRYCKPNPSYYREILKVLDLVPDEVLMVGNDVGEDMIARSLGMKVFLLTDCVINRTNADLSEYPRGSFSELADYIKSL